MCHCLQVLLAGVPLCVSRSCPAAGGCRVSLPRHRCEELANIVPLSAGVASGCASPCVTILPGSWWPQGEPAQHRCEELANIVPLSAGVASGCATPCVTILPGSWWPQGEPAQA
jgi:hypothetical protein